jgi:hypothetical protein
LVFILKTKGAFEDSKGAFLLVSTHNTTGALATKHSLKGWQIVAGGHSVAKTTGRRVEKE